MPEFPDVELYRSAIGGRILGTRLSAFQIASPHLLASVETPPEALVGRVATGVRRIGKQLVMEFEEELFCAVHLAVAGRFHWTASSGSGKPVRLSPRGNLAVWSFESEAGSGGKLRLVERSPKKRASIRIGQGPESLRALDRGGLEAVRRDWPDRRVLPGDHVSPLRFAASISPKTRTRSRGRPASTRSFRRSTGRRCNSESEPAVRQCFYGASDGSGVPSSARTRASSSATRASAARRAAASSRRAACSSP